jgi:hypothetical protein
VSSSTGNSCEERINSSTTEDIHELTGKITVTKGEIDDLQKSSTELKAPGEKKKLETKFLGR